MSSIQPSQFQESDAVADQSLEKIPGNSPSMPNLLMFLTFSYLTGCELFHKIAVTGKQVRDKLPNSGLLDQDKVITFKKSELSYECPEIPPVNSFSYALELSTAIRI